MIYLSRRYFIHVSKMSIVFRIAARNLLRHLHKTILLVVLIASGIGFLFVANAFFESSNKGLRAAYVGSLSGDAVMAPDPGASFGLFGSEVPIVSEYETIPALSEFSKLRDLLSASGRVAEWTPIVSVAARIQLAGFTQNGTVFGVDSERYFSLCSDLTILRGDARSLSSGGVFLNEAMAAKMETALGRRLLPADNISLSCYSGGSFRIRKGHFAGVYRYKARTEVLDRVILVDPTIARSLANYTLGYVSASRKELASVPAQDLDSLFEGGTDRQEPEAEGVSLDSIARVLGETGVRDSLVLTDQAAWSFILLKLRPGDWRRAAKELAASVSRAGMETRILDWRAAAGTSVLALTALQAVFYVSLAFIAFGAILVIMNSLVISVLERSAEIATMRGLGAGVGFIRTLFIIESLMLTFVASLVGILGGVAACLVLGREGIPISNGILVTLFGGDHIIPLISFSAIAFHMALALGIGLLSWIYPVAIALRIQPALAMTR